MGICRIYKIDNYYGTILPEHVDVKSGYLHEMIEEVDGKETVKESYDETGARLSRIETDYNTQGLVSEIREFSDDFVNPFQVVRYNYNDAGKLVMEQTFHHEMQSFGTQHVYDALGRIMQSRATDEEGVHHDVVFSYDVGALHAKKATYLNGNDVWKEIEYKYDGQKENSRVLEEIIDHKDDKFQSRIIRYYDFGTKPNGVVAEYYNSNGRFIEEVREIRDHKGNVLQEAVYASELPDAPPYSATVYKYDSHDNIVYLETSSYGRVSIFQVSAYDNRQRKAMEIVSGEHSSLYVYKYED